MEEAKWIKVAEVSEIVDGARKRFKWAKDVALPYSTTMAESTRRTISVPTWGIRSPGV